MKSESMALRFILGCPSAPSLPVASRPDIASELQHASFTTHSLVTTHRIPSAISPPHSWTVSSPPPPTPTHRCQHDLSLPATSPMRQHIPTCKHDVLPANIQDDARTHMRRHMQVEYIRRGVMTYRGDRGWAVRCTGGKSTPRRSGYAMSSHSPNCASLAPPHTSSASLSHPSNVSSLYSFELALSPYSNYLYVVGNVYGKGLGRDFLIGAHPSTEPKTKTRALTPST